MMNNHNGFPVLNPGDYPISSNASVSVWPVPHDNPGILSSSSYPSIVPTPSSLHFYRMFDGIGSGSILRRLLAPQNDNIQPGISGSTYGDYFPRLDSEYPSHNEDNSIVPISCVSDDSNDSFVDVVTVDSERVPENSKHTTENINSETDSSVGNEFTLPDIDEGHQSSDSSIDDNEPKIGLPCLKSHMEYCKITANKFLAKKYGLKAGIRMKVEDYLNEPIFNNVTFPVRAEPDHPVEKKKDDHISYLKMNLQERSNEFISLLNWEALNEKNEPVSAWRQESSSYVLPQLNNPINLLNQNASNTIKLNTTKNSVFKRRVNPIRKVRLEKEKKPIRGVFRRLKGEGEYVYYT